jgi:ATP-dependent protease HslVU (ClpYQ) peptidase subunit
MTCVVGMIKNDRVYIGADSAAATSGWTVRASALQKVFRHGSFLIGYTTSFRMGQILQYEVDYPEAEVYDETYMVTRFVPAVREKLKNLGYTKIDNNQEEGGDFLVGVAGQLFLVSSDFQVNHFLDGMAAVGCGAEYALGALLVRRSFVGHDPETSIRVALETAAYFSGGVIGPFTVLEG